MGRLSPLVSTPTHTPLVAFDQYNLRGRIILYICILSLAQQHFLSSVKEWLRSINATTACAYDSSHVYE